MHYEENSDMACKAPYYYSELKKNPGAKNESSEKNDLNKSENPYEKGRGFENPLLAIEPDISTCDIPEKLYSFQKKKKKKKSFPSSIYYKSNSLITNGVHGSAYTNYVHKEFSETSDVPSKIDGHKRRSSEPNIYEEISEKTYEDLSLYSESTKDIGSSSRWSKVSCESSYSSSKIALHEVEKVQQRHAQILENLNLDVEAMIMPEESISENMGSETKSSEHSSSLNVKALQILNSDAPLYFSSSLRETSKSTSSGTFPKSLLNRSIMNEYILQQSDFCPNSAASVGNSKKDLQLLEDNIYEEVDLHQMNQGDDDSNDISWIESEACIDHSVSSASEDVEELGPVNLASRFISKKKRNCKKAKENEKIVGSFTRWFSTRKKECELDKSSNKFNRHSKLLYADEDGYIDVKIPKKQRPPLSLPPIPLDLTPEKVKRRYIIGSIVDSENSYLNSLQRLIRDYKHPLENSIPLIVSANKISIMFHRVEQILQCHNIFGIALAQCIRQWDQEEKIGDVFIASFSKVMVSDIYSDFINNFSLAMETAKQASKNKSAFAEFLKVKQINSPDRLSFFGLMVKPVQRFPQFILMLQDLLKETPPGHQDRMSLQLALTQLESLAETLNERKREAEQHHAVREVLKHLGKFSFRSSSDKGHYLLRQDDVLQLQLDQTGDIVKSKDRRLFLLNDLLVSVAVTTPRNSDGLVNVERLNLKWAVPLQDVEILDDVAISSRNLISFSQNKLFGNTGVESHSVSSNDHTLYDELRDLIHDKNIVTRIEALVSSLRGNYKELNNDIMQVISSSIQESIHQKCEEISLLDSCCLQLSIPVRSKSNKDVVCFQMSNPSVRQEWITDLRLAKLALDSNNMPAWDIPEEEKRPISKLPLFVKHFTVFQSSMSSEVKCGCHYITTTGSIPQQYLWICSCDGINSHIVVMAIHATHLRQIAVYHLSDMKIVVIESVPGMPATKNEKELNIASPVSSVETVWIGTESKKLYVLEGSCPEKWEEIGNVLIPDSIMQLKYHLNQVYIGLANGSVMIFRRDYDGEWQLQNPLVISLGHYPITSLLPLGLTMYCSCGSKIFVINSVTSEIQKNYSIQHDNDDQAHILAHSGTGLWIALKNSATICLYHAETFRHLQDINIGANVNRILGVKNGENIPHSIHVTSLLASKGLLWVGTNVGIVLTVPLPRLEGVPIISGHVSIAFHAHQGPVNLLVNLQPKPLPISPIFKKPGSFDGEDNLISLKSKQISAASSPVSDKSLSGSGTGIGCLHASGAKTLPRGLSLCSHINPLSDAEETNDVYGLYADLMNVTDYEKSSQEKLYERLNHSDPELIHFHLSSSNEKVKQKSGRPRSWDLSTMAVSEDSDSSVACDTMSTATSTPTAEINAASPNHLSEETYPSAQKLSNEYRKLPTHVTLGRAVCKSAQKTLTDSNPKTALMLTGGCGYINWYKPEKNYSSKSCLDATVMIWEVKL